MLSLSLRPGEYLTIGGDVVLQYDRLSGDRCRIHVQAPREIAVVRGTVRERHGAARPECVFDSDNNNNNVNVTGKSRWRRTSVPWNRSKAQALAALRKTLAAMDARDESVRALRRQINHIFPPEI